MKRLMILMACLISACTSMPDGSRMLPGIETPRDRSEIDITLHEVSLPKAIEMCAMMQARNDPFWAAVLMVTGSVVYSCAVVQRDYSVKGKPWCEVVVVKGWKDTLEHELRHCEGYDHPAEPVREQRL